MKNRFTLHKISLYNLMLAQSSSLLLDEFQDMTYVGACTLYIYIQVNEKFIKFEVYIGIA